MVDPRKERIGLRCKACGYNGFINMQHRLITFICKNPPNESSGTPSKRYPALLSESSNFSVNIITEVIGFFYRDRKGNRKEKQKGHQNGETSPTHSPSEIQLSESGVENPDFNKKVNTF